MAISSLQMPGTGSKTRSALPVPFLTGTAVSGTDDSGGKASKPFDAMNGIAATMLLNLTSSVRFEGTLNVDLNDITMNMVPFPRMHFLMSSMAPLAAPKDLAKLAAPRSLDQVGFEFEFEFECRVRGRSFMSRAPRSLLPERVASSGGRASCPVIVRLIT